MENEIVANMKALAKKAAEAPLADQAVAFSQAAANLYGVFYTLENSKSISTSTSEVEQPSR